MNPRILLPLTLVMLLFLSACQGDESAETEQQLAPDEAPQFTISVESGELETSTHSLCWEECGNAQAQANDELRNLEKLAEQSPKFKIGDAESLALELGTEIEPTRYSYTEYQAGEEYGTASSSIHNIEEDMIEVIGDAPKTYIVRAEWYDEADEKLLGSIYTVFTVEKEVSAVR